MNLNKFFYFLFIYSCTLKELPDNIYYNKIFENDQIDIHLFVFADSTVKYSMAIKTNLEINDTLIFQGVDSIIFKNKFNKYNIVLGNLKYKKKVIYYIKKKYDKTLCIKNFDNTIVISLIEK